jgi:hypothetical protein
LARTIGVAAPHLGLPSRVEGVGQDDETSGVHRSVELVSASAQ